VNETVTRRALVLGMQHFFEARSGSGALRRASGSTFSAWGSPALQRTCLPELAARDDCLDRRARRFSCIAAVKAALVGRIA